MSVFYVLAQAAAVLSSVGEKLIGGKKYITLIDPS